MRKRVRGFYDNGRQISYSFGEIDFGAGGDALAIPVPYGAKGARIVDIAASVTETFTQDTTPGYVRLGTAADPDKFAELNLGVAADTDGYGTKDDDIFPAGSDEGIDLARDGDSGAALSQIEVAFVAPTGGTPAGKAYVNIAIEWW